MEELVNKVAASGLITFNLEDLYDQTTCMQIDIKDNLFMGLILKEKDFREFIKNHDWSQYTNCNVALFCSADAVIPTWAYMLVSNKLTPFAKEVFFGTAAQLQQHLIINKINAINFEQYRDQRIVIKGCSKFDVPAGAYVSITQKMSEVAKSIMYGEPCSTVPIFKRK